MVVGDLNFPLIDWDNNTHRGNLSSKSSSSLLSFCQSFNLKQVIDQPTHGLNTLDIVLTSETSLLENIEILPPFSTSDHNGISFTIVGVTPKAKSSAKLRNYAKGNYDAIVDALCSVDWVAFINSHKDIDDCYENLIRVFLNLISRYVPRYKDSKIWETYPQHIQTLRAKLAFYHGRKTIFGNGKYLMYAHKLKRALARHSLLKEKQIAQSKNAKRLFCYCRQKLQLHEPIPTMTASNSDQLTTDAQKAELFASYFESVYKKPSSLEVEVKPFTQATLEWVDISTETVYNILRRLPNRLSTSPDQIPYIFLKRAALGLAAPLTLLFNRCLLRAETPTLWRVGYVRPIYKKGSRNDVKNYRPICLTSSISKVLERIICRKIVSYLSENDLISPNQHGFLSNRSTTSALLSTVPLWHKEIEKGNFVSVCYIDYRKAFDSISIPLLLRKLTSFGINGCLLRFLRSFLTERSQSVMINESRSRNYKTISGVPQGTCLGPLMFLMYVNDLAKVLPPGSFCSMYADDSKVYTINDCNLLQLALDAVAKWSRTWELDISLEKTTIMRFGRNHPDVHFTINGKVLPESTKVRDLGIVYTNKFEFDDYIREIVGKASCKSNYILRAFKSRDLKLLFKLFTVFVRPQLEYCSQLWSPYKKNLVDSIEQIQKSFTYRCFLRKGLLRKSYEERMKALGSESLAFRRKIADLVFMYKLITEESDLKLYDIFDRPPMVEITRGHPYRIKPERPKTAAYAGSFVARSVHQWNNLDAKLFRWKRSCSFQAHLVDSLQAEIPN
ncbi:hypothetical protein Y032_0020g6 [Ancylostoma ceylanicum]|nr:hypothetical protein Y032_0020g6 [Ancylostoma ceylanicum]